MRQDPADAALPDRMKDSGIRTIVAIDRRHVAPDHRPNAVCELLLDVFEPFDFHDGTRRLTTIGPHHGAPATVHACSLIPVVVWNLGGRATYPGGRIGPWGLHGCRCVQPYAAPCMAGDLTTRLHWGRRRLYTQGVPRSNRGAPTNSGRVEVGVPPRVLRAFPPVVGRLDAAAIWRGAV